MASYDALLAHQRIGSLYRVWRVDLHAFGKVIIEHRRAVLLATTIISRR